MMEGTIRVSDDALKAKASEVSSAITNFENAYNSIKAMINGSSGYWQGQGGDSFRSMFQAKEEAMEGVIQGLKSHPRKLLQMAGITEETEKKITEANVALPNNVIY